MGDNIFKKIDSGETTVHDGKLIKFIMLALLIGGLLLGIAIGMH